MMKKRYAVMMTAAVLTGIMTATALAEDPGMDSRRRWMAMNRCRR